MDNKELMAKYGELMIRAEIINNQINEVKKQIAESMNKKPEIKPEVKAKAKSE